MNTGNQIVDEITQLKFEGNIIPNTWYCHIKRETKKKKFFKADILAINILADLIYWYRASEIREEETGKTVGYKKKFKSNKYQKWYASWAEKFGVTKRQIQSSMKILVDFGIVDREVIDITTDQGLKLTGVTYFTPVVEKIKYINIPVSEKHKPIYSQCNTPQQKKYDPPQKNVGGGTKKREDTETPTEIPTENSAKGKTKNSKKQNKAESNSSSDINPDSNSVTDSVTDSYPTDTNPYSDSYPDSVSEFPLEDQKEKESFVAEPDSVNESDSEDWQEINDMSQEEWEEMLEAEQQKEPPKINRKMLRKQHKASLNNKQFDEFKKAHESKFNGDGELVEQYINHELKMWAGSDRRVKGDKRVLLFEKEFFIDHPIAQHFKNMTEDQRQEELRMA